VETKQDFSCIQLEELKEMAIASPLESAMANTVMLPEKKEEPSVLFQARLTLSAVCCGARRVVHASSVQVRLNRADKLTADLPPGIVDQYNEADRPQLRLNID
jgi:hypothetical protein